jgi:hypothetical protein
VLSAARDAAGVAELERVGVGIAPDLGQVLRGGECWNGGTHRLSTDRTARCHNGPGDDPAAQHHVRAPAGIGVGERIDYAIGCRHVPIDVDAAGGQDLAVGIQHHVIPDQQPYRPTFGEDLTARHHARRIRLVAGRRAVAFGKTDRRPSGAVPNPRQGIRRIAYRDVDVATVGMCQQQTQRAGGFGQMDTFVASNPT